MTLIPTDMIQAYKKTEFRVLEPPQVTLRIGQHSAKLELLYAEQHVSSAGFVTAWNPFSAETSEHENKAAQLDLLRKLSLGGIPTLNAIGIDPSGEWPGEESIFMLGVGLEETKSLGVEFQQNAVVWVGANAVPQLVLLR